MQAVEKSGYYVEASGRVNHTNPETLMSSEMLSLAQLNWRNTHAAFLSLSPNIRKQVWERGLGNRLEALLRRERQVPDN